MEGPRSWAPGVGAVAIVALLVLPGCGSKVADSLEDAALGPMTLLEAMRMPVWKGGQVLQIQDTVEQVGRIDTDRGSFEYVRMASTTNTTIIEGNATTKGGPVSRTVAWCTSVFLESGLLYAPGQPITVTLHMENVTYNGIPGVYPREVNCMPLNEADQNRLAEQRSRATLGTLRRQAIEGEWLVYAFQSTYGDSWTVGDFRAYLTQDDPVAARYDHGEAWGTLGFALRAYTLDVFQRGINATAPRLDELTSLTQSASSGGRLRFEDRDHDGRLGDGDILKVRMDAPHRGLDTALLTLEDKRSQARAQAFIAVDATGPWSSEIREPVGQLQLVTPPGSTNATTFIVGTLLGPAYSLDKYQFTLTRGNKTYAIERRLNQTGNINGASYTFADVDKDGLLDRGDELRFTKIPHHARMNLTLERRTVFGPEQVLKVQWIVGGPVLAKEPPQLSLATSKLGKSIAVLNASHDARVLDYGGTLTFSARLNNATIVDNATLAPGVFASWPDGSFRLDDLDESGSFSPGDVISMIAPKGAKVECQVDLLWGQRTATVTLQHPI